LIDFSNFNDEQQHLKTTTFHCLEKRKPKKLKILSFRLLTSATLIADYSAQVTSHKQAHDDNIVLFGIVDDMSFDLLHPALISSEAWWGQNSQFWNKVAKILRWCHLTQ